MKNTELYPKDRLSSTGGFTLVELLIGMAIIGVILLTISNLFVNTIKDTETISSKADLVKIAQHTQQIISGRISDAIYIWSPAITSGKEFNLGNSADKQAKTDKVILGMNNNTSLAKWQVKTNDNRFLAMILPPRVQYNASNCISSASRTMQDNNCYRFIAYYPLKVADLQSLPTNSRPATSSPNEWAIMEYRHSLIGWKPIYTNDGSNTLSNLPSVSDLSASSTKGHILINHIQANSVSFTPTLPTNSSTLSEVPDGNVHVSFTFEKRASRKLLVVPINFIATSRNWYCKSTNAQVCGPQN